MDKMPVAEYEHIFIGNDANGFLITNASGEVVWCNKTIETTTGYTLEEMKGKKPGALFQGPDTDGSTISYMGRQIKAGKSFECEILNYTKDNKPYWIHLAGQPIRNNKGELVNFIAQQTFINTPLQGAIPRKTRKDAELYDYFNFLFQNIDVGVIITNKQYQVAYANQRVMNLFGFKSSPEIIHGLHYADVLQRVGNLLKNEKETRERIKHVVEQAEEKSRKL